MRSRVFLFGAFLSWGCSTVTLPNTPEAQACNRQCMLIYNQCIASGQDALPCSMQRKNCWRSCPGAYESGGAAASPAQPDEDLNRRGVELRRAGRDADALVLFQEAYNMTGSPRATAQLGLVHQALGNWGIAEPLVEKALQTPNDPWINQYSRTLQHALAVIRQHLTASRSAADTRVVREPGGVPRTWNPSQLLDLRTDLNPKYNPSLDPKYNPSIDPKYNPSLDPKYNVSIDPKYNPSLDPGYNVSIDPKYKPCMNPRFNADLSSDLQRRVRFFLFGTRGELLGLLAASSDECLAFMDSDGDWKGPAIADGHGGYTLFRNDNTWWAYLRPNSEGGLNIFSSSDAAWIGYGTGPRKPLDTPEE